MQMTGTASKFDFASYAALRRQLVETHLNKYLIEREPVKLWESMRYSVLSGGKRLRALLCIAAAEAIYATQNRDQRAAEDLEQLSATPLMEAVLPCCCAIEMVHAMSLIHDDLPSMDNDDFRRGKPTNHKVRAHALG